MSLAKPTHAAALGAFGAALAHPRSAAEAFVAARNGLTAALGEGARVDATCVAALFAGITRIVDATGLPDDPPEKYDQLELMLKRVLPGAAVATVAACVALCLRL